MDNIKSERTPFTITPNEVFNDINLTMQAKYVFIYMLSKPKDWKFYESEIAKHNKNGITATRSAIKELIEYGYIDRVKLRSDKGNFAGYIYEITKYIKEPFLGFPKTDKPKTDNLTLINNNTTNNKDNNIYTSSNDKDDNIYTYPNGDDGILTCRIKKVFNTNKFLQQIKVCYNNIDDCGFDIEEILDIVKYFIKCFNDKFKGERQHPQYSDKTIKSILESFSTNYEDGFGRDIPLTSTEEYYSAIDAYFENDFKNIKCNYGLAHFMSGDMRKICALRAS